jgi:uncharacterized protein (DUF58 family)
LKPTPVTFTLSDLKQTASLDLLARQLVEGFVTGLHKSPYHGFSVEFSEHRLYNEGESTRHIDWKVYARTDKLFTKQYAEETNLRCLLVMDTSASMYYPQDSRAKITFSTFAAASLAYLLQHQRDAVGLCTFANAIDLLTQVRSTRSHLDKIFAELESVLKSEPGKQKVTQTNIAETLHEIAEKIHKRSLVVIFSDFFDARTDTGELFKALQHLVHKKHEVLVFHVTDKSTEYTFDFDSRPTEFIDLESGQRIKVNPEEVKELYAKTAETFYRSVKQQCQRFKIDFIEADVADGFQPILQTFLIKRSKMR